MSANHFMSANPFINENVATCSDSEGELFDLPPGFFIHLGDIIGLRGKQNIALLKSLFKRLNNSKNGRLIIGNRELTHLRALINAAILTPTLTLAQLKQMYPFIPANAPEPAEWFRAEKLESSEGAMYAWLKKFTMGDSLDVIVEELSAKEMPFLAQLSRTQQYELAMYSFLQLLKDHLVPLIQQGALIQIIHTPSGKGWYSHGAPSELFIKALMNGRVMGFDLGQTFNCLDNAVDALNTAFQKEVKQALQGKPTMFVFEEIEMTLLDLISSPAPFLESLCDRLPTELKHYTYSIITGQSADGKKNMVPPGQHVLQTLADAEIRIIMFGHDPKGNVGVTMLCTVNDRPNYEYEYGKRTQRKDDNANKIIRVTNTDNTYGDKGCHIIYTRKPCGEMTAGGFLIIGELGPEPRYIEWDVDEICGIQLLDGSWVIRPHFTLPDTYVTMRQDGFNVVYGVVTRREATAARLEIIHDTKRILVSVPCEYPAACHQCVLALIGDWLKGATTLPESFFVSQATCTPDNRVIFVTVNYSIKGNNYTAMLSNPAVCVFFHLTAGTKRYLIFTQRPRGGVGRPLTELPAAQQKAELTPDTMIVNLLKSMSIEIRPDMLSDLVTIVPSGGRTNETIAIKLLTVDVKDPMLFVEAFNAVNKEFNVGNTPTSLVKIEMSNKQELKKVQDAKFWSAMGAYLLDQFH